MNRAQAEVEVRRRLRPELRALSRVASALELVLRSMVSRELEAEAEGRVSAFAILAGRLADDIRSMCLLSLSGYAHQVASIGATSYEVAFTMAFVADNESRAEIWFSHSTLRSSPWKRREMVKEVVGVAQPNDPHAWEKQEVFYTSLFWFKHVNPVALRQFAPSDTPLRHLINTDPNLVSLQSHKVRLTLSLRAPVLSLMSLASRDLLTPEELGTVATAARRYFAVENELLKRASEC